MVRYNEWTISDSNKLHIFNDTILLNNQDLISKYYDNSYTVQNNSDGYPIGWGEKYNRGYYVYSNGNVVKLVQESFKLRENNYVKTGEVYTKRIDYDVNHQNLPIIQSLTGKQSHNLPIKETIEVVSFWNIKDGTVYQKEYIYTFDNQGRVKRRIAYGKAVNPMWMLEEDLYGIGITDYEYECR